MFSSITSCTKILNLNSRLFSTTPTTQSNIGFIGLGNMGGHMARNLVKKGHNVKVFDLSTAAVDSVVSVGGAAASSIGECVNDVDSVITMLPSSPHVRSVYYEGSVFDAARPDTLLIDCSTIDPGVSRELDATAAERGFRIIDAPVSGGVTGAEQATLTFMVGGSQANTDAARPLLETMGKNIVYCGESGCGQVTKLCNNLALGIEMVGISEAMNLGVKLGMDPKLLASVFNTSSARCWSSDTYNPVPGVIEGIPSSNNYNGGFGCQLMAKDISLAVNAAYAAKQALPLGATTLQLYNLLTTKGYAKKDFSAIYDFLAKEDSPKD